MIEEYLMTECTLNIDDEWNNFITQNYDENALSDEEDIISDFNNINIDNNNKLVIPEPTDIYISTKSKIAYLTKPVDLKVFWNIPVIPYTTPANGVIKKQIKINSKTPDELAEIQSKLTNELYYDENIITHIDNPNGRIKFKDIRKITIGISKKDIMSYRSKKKQAFYNCFVTIIRLKIDDEYKEFHVKIFNTGKLDMPGVRNDAIYYKILNYVVEMLQPYYDEPLSYFENSDTVLINSNFNCGFYIDREALFNIIRTKYNINAIYDPCSYPGIQCKFYYNTDVGVQNGVQVENPTENIVEISFMIFRTGSVLIVGMCDEYMLQDIYHFLKSLLKTEFNYICQSIITKEEMAIRAKKKKPRRKTLYITMDADTDTDTDNKINEVAEAVVAEVKVKKTRKPRSKKLDK